MTQEGRTKLEASSYVIEVESYPADVSVQSTDTPIVDCYKISLAETVTFQNAEEIMTTLKEIHSENVVIYIADIRDSGHTLLINTVGHTLANDVEPAVRSALDTLELTDATFNGVLQDETEVPLAFGPEWVATTPHDYSVQIAKPSIDAFLDAVHHELSEAWSADTQPSVEYLEYDGDALLFRVEKQPVDSTDTVQTGDRAEAE